MRNTKETSCVRLKKIYIYFFTFMKSSDYIIGVPYSFAIKISYFHPWYTSILTGVNWFLRQCERKERNSIQREITKAAVHNLWEFRPSLLEIFYYRRSCALPLRRLLHMASREIFNAVMRKTSNVQCELFPRPGLTFFFFFSFKNLKFFQMHLHTRHTQATNHPPFNTLTSIVQSTLNKCLQFYELYLHMIYLTGI